MFLTRFVDSAVQSEWLIYDAILMELSDPHPHLTIFEEADLKGRLLKIIDTSSGDHDPPELMRRFREAMDSI